MYPQILLYKVLISSHNSYQFDGKMALTFFILAAPHYWQANVGNIFLKDFILENILIKNVDYKSTNNTPAITFGANIFHYAIIYRSIIYQDNCFSKEILGMKGLSQLGNIGIDQKICMSSYQIWQGTSIPVQNVLLSCNNLQ